MGERRKRAAHAAARKYNREHDRARRLGYLLEFLALALEARRPRQLELWP